MPDIIIKACSFDAKERYNTPTEMRMELQGLLDNISAKRKLPVMDIVKNDEDVDVVEKHKEFESVSGVDISEQNNETVSAFDAIDANDDSTVSIFDNNDENDATVSAFDIMDENAGTVSIYDDNPHHYIKKKNLRLKRKTYTVKVKAVTVPIMSDSKSKASERKKIVMKLSANYLEFIKCALLRRTQRKKRAMKEAR